MPICRSDLVGLHQPSSNLTEEVNSAIDARGIYGSRRCGGRREARRDTPSLHCRERCSLSGPRTIWLGPEAARSLDALPRSEGRDRVFPGDLTSTRLYTFWVGLRDEAGLPSLRIPDCRHTWASQGVMNGAGLTTVGRLLGHRQRETTAIYAHLNDGALRDAVAQAAAVIARTMGTGWSRHPCQTRRSTAIHWQPCSSSPAP